MMVVTAHFLAAFYPWAVFADGTRAGSAAALATFSRHYGWEGLFHWPPLSLFTAGHFAVCLFFVLSGYVLSVSFIGNQSRWPGIVGAIIKRPFRLLGLAIMSLLAGALLWSSGLLWHREVAELSGAGRWLNMFWAGEFDWSVFWRALLAGKAGSEYNPPLWTIKIEVIGSFLVFFTLLAINWMPRLARLLALLALLIATLGTYYDGFALGMLFAQMFKADQPGPDGVYPETPAWQPGPASAGALVAVVVLLAAYPYYAAPALLPDWTPITRHISMAGAAVVFLIIHRTLAWRAWLSHRWLIKLGEWSYAIYVLHFLLMASLTSWIVVTATPMIGYGPATIVAALVSLPCLMILSMLANQWIDKPSIAAGRWVERHGLRLIPRRVAS